MKLELNLHLFKWYLGFYHEDSTYTTQTKQYKCTNYNILCFTLLVSKPV